MRIMDLHTHTSISDGTDSPAELVAAAQAAGLSAVAITDHDSVSGICAAAEEGRRRGVEVIPGIEITAAPQIAGAELHLLGYFIDPENAALRRALAEAEEHRVRRGVEIERKLQAMQIPVTMADAQSEAHGAEIVSRVHFARALCARGYATDVKDAFARYLGKGCPAYVPRPLLSAEDAVRLIRVAGGVASAAHLHHIGLQDDALRDFLASLIPAGLCALEGYYSEYTPEMERKYRALAAQLGLALSGGSDYHGGNKPEIQLGRLPIPYALLSALRAAR